MRLLNKHSIFLLAAVGSVLTAPNAVAGLTISLTANLPSTQPVGIPVTWTANLTGGTGILPQYRFMVTPPNGKPQLLRDFSPANQVQWTSLDEGIYQISVRAADPRSGASGDASMSFVFISRVPQGVPSVMPTSHPLVALYSAPPCSAGSVKVFFRPASSPGPWLSTPAKTCLPNASRNFYVAGMKASTQYVLQQQVVNGTQITNGSQVFFTTAAIPAILPKVTVTLPPSANASVSQDIYLLADITSSAPQMPPVAVDLSGNVVWYYPSPGKGPMIGLVRPALGGTMLSMFAGARGGPDGGAALAQFLRETDLSGGLVRETNATALSGQLAKMGKDPVSWLSHEALRLANGHTLILGSAERLLTNVQGPGTIDVVGDMILDLDPNFQVAWTWNSFDSLDKTRKATLGEICTVEHVFGPTKYVCPLQRALVANDWTHANAIAYLPADGNLLLSVRNQDWVVKIDYRNGAGTGQVLWKMGKDGSFSQPTANPSDWFSHQHSVLTDGNHLALYDNGNVRVTEAGGVGHSRGQVLTFDEQSLRTSLLLNADLGVYSGAAGSAQLLANGNYQFLSGVVPTPAGPTSQTMEVQLSGTPAYSATFGSFGYRGFRVHDLYSYKP